CADAAGRRSGATGNPVARARRNPARLRRLRKHPPLAGRQRRALRRRAGARRLIRPRTPAPDQTANTRKEIAMTTNARALLAIALVACLAPPALAQALNEGVRPPGDHTSRTTHTEMRRERSRPLDANLHSRRNRDGSLLRPVIGVVLSPDDVAGVRISGVTPNGGGARAG